LAPSRALDGSWIGVDKGGEKVGVNVLVVGGGSCVSIEVAVGLVSRAVIVVELHAFVKDNNRVIIIIDDDVSFFTSSSMSRFSWGKPVG